MPKTVRVATTLKAQFVLVVGAAHLAACGGDTSSPRGPLVRDSAGIRIVENPARAPELAWHLSPEPVVQIGGASAGDQYELFEVRSAVRLSDGRIIVANAGSRELRFYSSEGTFVRSVGRRGDGPGEFQNLQWMERTPGDSLITYDIRHLRLSVFDSSGAFARSFLLQSSDAVPFANVVDMYRDRTFLAQGFVNTGNVTPSGMQRYDTPLYHFAAEGALLAELGMFPGDESYFKSFADGGFSSYDAFFPLSTYRVAAGDRLYIAQNDTYELRRYTSDGALTDIVRRAHTPVSVTREHVRLEREQRLTQSHSDEGRRALSEVLDEIPVPETFPAYQDVRVDDNLNVWVQEYVMPGVGGAAWSVFDSTGVLLGQINVPLLFEPYHIGTDFMLGEWRDDLDIEYVQLYELVKP